MSFETQLEDAAEGDAGCRVHRLGGLWFFRVAWECHIGASKKKMGTFRMQKGIIHPTHFCVGIIKKNMIQDPYQTSIYDRK